METNVEKTVAKAKMIVELAQQEGYDEYEVAVIDQFGEYLRGVTSLVEVDKALAEWYDTLCE